MICNILILNKETILNIWKMSVFDKRGMWTISTSNYASYLQCMTAQNDVEEDNFIDAGGGGGNPTLDSLRLCELY